MSAFLCRASATHHLLERQQQVKQELELDGKFELSFELLHAQGIDLAIWKEENEQLPLGLQFFGDGAERNRHFVKMMHQHKVEIDADEMWKH